MELSLIGNEDIGAASWIPKDKKDLAMSNTYFTFVRIDNTCGYCQFSYKSMKSLFEHHLSSLHKNYTIYEFNTQLEFIKWCYSLTKQYNQVNKK